MTDLTQALREALAATAETDPRELDAAGLVVWHLCTDRIEQLIERLIARHDEAGPAAREVLQRIARGVTAPRPSPSEVTAPMHHAPPANGPAQPPERR